jgi:hypothetical protein
MIYYSWVLNDTDSVGNIKGIKVLSESDIGLLLTIRADQSVNRLNLDLIQRLNGILDLLLGSQNVADEGEGINVLNLLHGSFSGKRRNNNSVLVHLVQMGDRFPGELRGLGELSGLRLEEAHVAANFLNSNNRSLLQGLSGRRSLGNLGCLGLSSLRNSSGLRHTNEHY